MNQDLSLLSLTCIYADSKLEYSRCKPSLTELQVRYVFMCIIRQEIKSSWSCSDVCTI